MQAGRGPPGLGGAAGRSCGAFRSWCGWWGADPRACGAPHQPGSRGAGHLGWPGGLPRGQDPTDAGRTLAGDGCEAGERLTMTLRREPRHGLVTGRGDSAMRTRGSRPLARGPSLRGGGEGDEEPGRRTPLGARPLGAANIGTREYCGPTRIHCNRVGAGCRPGDRAHSERADPRVGRVSRGGRSARAGRTARGRRPSARGAGRAW